MLLLSVKKLEKCKNRTKKKLDELKTKFRKLLAELVKNLINELEILYKEIN